MTAEMSGHASLGYITIECMDDQHDAFPAFITSLNGGGIVRVKVPRELTEGSRIQVHAGPEYSGTATVLYSVGSNGEHWATIQIHREDRRREPRIVVNTKARLVVFHCNLQMAADARIIDVSKSGLCLTTAQPIPFGTLLKIVVDGAIIFAEARYCRQVRGAIGSYKLGVQIQTVILHGKTEPDWRHTPAELWGSLALAVRNSGKLMPNSATERCQECRDELCRFFPEQGNCVVGAERRQDWNCEVCRAIERWKLDARPIVLVREIMKHTGLYLHPLDNLNIIPPNQRSAYVMQVRLQDSPSTDIRLAIHTILESAAQTWIEQPDQSIRVR